MMLRSCGTIANRCFKGLIESITKFLRSPRARQFFCKQIAVVAEYLGIVYQALDAFRAALENWKDKVEKAVSHIVLF